MAAFEQFGSLRETRPDKDCGLTILNKVYRSAVCILARFAILATAMFFGSCSSSGNAESVLNLTARPPIEDLPPFVRERIELGESFIDSQGVIHQIGLDVENSRLVATPAADVVVYAAPYVDQSGVCLLSLEPRSNTGISSCTDAGDFNDHGLSLASDSGSSSYTVVLIPLKTDISDIEPGTLDKSGSSIVFDGLWLEAGVRDGKFRLSN